MQVDATTRSFIATADVDLLLSAQIGVAWAGERGERGVHARLGWWDTELMYEFGGEDLFRRLLPSTHDWAVVQAVREAARRQDERMRNNVHDPDTLVSLFRLGFAVDERADERLLELKRTGATPGVALPRFGDLMGESFRRETFEQWVRGFGDARFDLAPAGRHLKGSLPSALSDVVRSLVAALAPLVERYPLPHYRRSR